MEVIQEAMMELKPQLKSRWNLVKKPMSATLMLYILPLALGHTEFCLFHRWHRPYAQSAVVILAMGMDAWFSDHAKLPESLQTFEHINITLVIQHQPQAAPAFAFQAGEDLFYSHHPMDQFRRYFR